MNFEALTEFYFTDLILLVCNFLAFLTAIKRSVSSGLFLIKIYVIGTFAFNFLLYLISIFLPETPKTTAACIMAMNAYTIFEFTLVIFFTLKSIESEQLRKIILSIYTAFCFFWFLVLTRFKEINSGILFTVAGIESLAITIISILGLNFMLKTNKLSELLKSSKFVILVGCLGYFSFATPYFLGVTILNAFDPKIMKVCASVNLIVCSAYFIIIRKGLNVVH